MHQALFNISEMAEKIPHTQKYIPEMFPYFVYGVCFHIEKFFDTTFSTICMYLSMKLYIAAQKSHNCPNNGGVTTFNST